MAKPPHRSWCHGVLVIDKPAGPTSHDVVARIRRTLGESRIGHTGTLDPRASGVLVLVVGHATRLASVLTSDRKVYDATVRLGVATTTGDAEGAPLGPPVMAPVTDDQISRALERFRGPIAQVPPAHSAKKVGGRRAYVLARQAVPVELAPVPVTVHALECVSREGDVLRLVLTVSAGFYVRALARDLGDALGCGGHLASLRRTASGAFGLEHAQPLEAAERSGRDLVERLIPPAAALPDLPGYTLTDQGVTRARHGSAIGQQHVTGHVLAVIDPGHLVKLMSPDGRLVALARPAGSVLHPVTVLG